MKLTRRDFVHAGCTAAAASLVPNKVDAWTHGAATAGGGGSQSRVNINVPSNGQLYLNLAKQMSLALSPGSANQTSDGYPVNGILAASVSANLGFPSGYFGKFAWQWTGTGSMESNGPPWIVYSGGLNVYPNAGAAQDGAGGMIIAPNSGSAGINMAGVPVIFNYGWNIQSVSNSGGLILITTKTNFAVNVLSGATVLITGTGTSADNATTPWTITMVNGSSFTLNGSSFVSGNASAAGTAILDGVNPTIYLYGGQTFTNMTNLIICKYTNGTADDYHDITVNGYIADTVLVNQLIYLNNAGSRGTPAWLRFMDLLTGGRSYNGDFANRMLSTAITYNNSRYVNNHWIGSITNTSDALSCSDPTTSTWGGSAYNDGAIVQGTAASTNSTGFPTLAVGGHPAMPIYYDSPGLVPLSINIPSAASAAGQTMTFTFNVGGASYLHSGTNYTFTYTTVSGDTGSATTFLVNLGTALQADTILSAASIQFHVVTSTFEIGIYSPTSHANGTTGAAGNAMVLTYSGTPTCNLYRTIASTLSTTGGTYIFNSLLNGWIYYTGGISSNIPLEFLTDLCNRVGAHCYFNWDITTSSFVTSVTTFFASNLNSGLKFGTEVGNEVWNSGAFPYFQYLTLGACFGWSTPLEVANIGYCGLRTVQYAALSRAAWAAAGKPASTHVVFSQEAIFNTNVGSGAYNNQLLGAPMNGTTYPFYGSYGGLGATSTGNHDTAGTRPIDASDYIGCAPYWGSPWFAGSAAGNSFGAIEGTVAQNAPMLQASFDYANGSSATAFASLVNQFNGTTLRPDFCSGNVLGPIHAGVQGTTYETVFADMEATAAAFDTFRMGGTNTLAANNSGAAAKLGIICYEGGPNWAMGADGNNGVNSQPGSPSLADAGALANAIGQNGLNWSPSAYTLTGTPAISSASYNNSTGIVTLTLASSVQYSSGATFTGSIAASGPKGILTVASGLVGKLNVGQVIGGSGVTAAYITSFGTGTGGLGTYNTSVPQNVGSQAMTAGDTVVVSGLTGTGSVASLNGTFLTAPSSFGTQLEYLASSGLTLTINSGVGTVFDQTAANWEVATNIINMAQAWKYDASYKNFIKTSYYQKLYNYSGANREIHPGQYGYNASQWGLFPGTYSAGSQYANYDAIHEWNA